MNTVHLVVPDGIDDPERPSGGNTYDRQVSRGLAASGWSVSEHAVLGAWPQPDVAARSRLADLLSGLADDAVVLLDGLIASTVPEILLVQVDRLRLVVLVHMPLDNSSERAVMRAAAAVVTTSHWTRGRLLDMYALEPRAVHVAQPGADPADVAPGTAGGGELLCVAAVTPLKGHDVLFGALAMTNDLAVRCVCVGSLTRDPEYVRGLRQRIRDDRIGERVTFTGARCGADLHYAYAAADVLVLSSRAETYGMVITEALARALPVIATHVGGVPESLGLAPDGSLPGLLIPPDDPSALAAALRAWVGDPELRRRLRRSARERRGTLANWSDTTDQIAQVLTEVAA